MSCSLRCHDEWVSIPLEASADVGGWVDEWADELASRSKARGVPLDTEFLRRDLRARAVDSRGRSPVYAFALYLDGIESACAVLEVDFIYPDENVPEISLDWIAATFSVEDFGAPDIVRARLPLGEAVRIRQNLAGAAKGLDGERMLMETLTYGVVPECSDSAVVMLVSWTSPGVDDLVEEMADAIVHTLEVEMDL